MKIFDNPIPWGVAAFALIVGGPLWLVNQTPAPVSVSAPPAVTARFVEPNEAAPSVPVATPDDSPDSLFSDPKPLPFKQWRSGLVAQAGKEGRESADREIAFDRAHNIPIPDPDAPEPSSSQSVRLTTPTTPTESESSRKVWVNTKTGVYHLPGSRWYGVTAEGKYVSESQAIAEGDTAAANGQ